MPGHDGREHPERIIGPLDSAYISRFPSVARFQGFDKAFSDYEAAKSMHVYTVSGARATAERHSYFDQGDSKREESEAAWKQSEIESSLQVLREVLVNGLRDMYGVQAPSAFLNALNQAALILKIQPNALAALVDAAHVISSEDLSTTGNAVGEVLDN